MNVLSLFDGMSCGQIALERVGIKVDKYYASEIDKHAIKVTQDNYPETIQLGDVTKLDGKELGKIELLIGGSPCQGFSFAGKQLNFDDPRSALFFEFVRLLKETNPRYFLLENVKMKKEYQDIISSYIGVEPVLINSSLVSAQSRSRLYWTNIPNVSQPYDKKVSMKDVVEPGYYSTRDKSYCIDANYGKGTNFRRYFYCGSRQLVLEKGYYPDGMEKETANGIMHNDGNRWRKLSPLECERLQTVPENYTTSVSDFQRYKMLGNGWTVDVIAHIFKGLKES
jgi:site-specific DNA-cytosine methylase